MTYTRASVAVLRRAAYRLEREAAELRRVADALEAAFDAGDAKRAVEAPTPAPLAPEVEVREDGETVYQSKPAEPPPAPPQDKTLITPEVAGYRLKKVRCSGCPQRPRCPNILERKRIGKVNKCPECHAAEAATRARLARAKRKPRPKGATRKPVLKAVRCSGCPQRPNCTNVVKRYRVLKVNQCWKCIATQVDSSAQRYRAIKQSTSEPKVRSVWHGGEGLARCSASSLGGKSFEEVGA